MKKFWSFPILVLFYLATHLVNLTGMPVFADEAIYIRWSQLIISDWQQYFFFSLNDGKTPLFNWLLVPFLLLFSDPLFAGRLLSVIIGLGQMWAMTVLIQKAGGNRTDQLFGSLLVAILPFWFFHHRMALMDALLTFFLTLAIAGAIDISHKKTKHFSKSIVVTGLSFGLALLSKLPAILVAPLLVLFPLFSEKSSTEKKLHLTIGVSTAIGIGLFLFALLKLNPAFSQLFSRGSDFLYPFSQVLFEGKWRETIASMPTHVGYFISYLSPSALLLTGYSLFRPLNRTHQLLAVCACLFFLPIGLLGKVVYPRYYLPIALFITPVLVLGLRALYNRFIQGHTLSIKKVIASLAMTILVTSIVHTSLPFMVYSWTDTNSIPFVPADQTQYLTEWSSGHGVKEVAELIKEESHTKRVAVATEGFFGTLPDGLLMYFFNEQTENILIEGIGQPVHGVRKEFKENSKDFDSVWLVVNSHRLEMSIPEDKLIAQYCRPFSAPCLQVWDITELSR